MSTIPSVATTLLLALAQVSLTQSLQVVSLTHHSGDARRGAVRMRPDGVSGENVTLKQLIRYAYELQDVQIQGPSWIETKGYDLVAKADIRMAPEQVRSALQK